MIIIVANLMVINKKAERVKDTEKDLFDLHQTCSLHNLMAVLGLEVHITVIKVAFCPQH